MGSKPKSIVGYNYYFGIHMGIGRGPCDEIVEIAVGDRPAWRGNVSTKTTFTINQPYLFGGEESEGGIVGHFTFLPGHANQSLDLGETNQYALANMLNPGNPAQNPGFRGITSCFFNGLIGNNPYPKPWKMRVRRIFQGWDGAVFEPGLALVPMSRPQEPGEQSDLNIKAMNPAHIIYEALTNRSWGRGLPSTALNIPSFAACANTLLSEGFGMCIKWSRRDTIEAFIQAVLDHIGGTIYTDRTTALLTLALIRNDFNRDDLPLFTMETGLLSISEASVSSDASLVNELQVSYTDPITGKVRMVKVDNLANVQASAGAFKSIKRSYLGLPTASLALRVAQRDLLSMGSTLRRFNVELDRRGWDLVPGQPIRIEDPTRNLRDMVVRVGTIDYGNVMNGRIKIGVVQDVFALPATSYSGVEPPAWVPINNNPCVGRHRVFEMPYGMLAAVLDAAELDYVPDQAAYVGALMEQGRPMNAGFNLMVKSGAIGGGETPPNDDYICEL